MTVVPSGYREFCYIVDGKFQVSTRHPTNAEGSCNWRTVYGPPRISPFETSASVPEKMHWFVEFAVGVSDAMNRILPFGSSENEDHTFEDRRNDRRDVELAGARRGRRKTRETPLDRPLRIALTAIVVYAAFVLSYVSWRQLVERK